MVESINRKFDDILAFLVDGVLPEWQKIDSLETYNDPREPIAVMYHNAQLFARTKQIADAEKRRNTLRETYEEVCRFMRYYHGLTKRTKRD